MMISLKNLVAVALLLAVGCARVELADDDALITPDPPKDTNTDTTTDTPTDTTTDTKDTETATEPQNTDTIDTATDTTDTATDTTDTATEIDTTPHECFSDGDSDGAPDCINDDCHTICETTELIGENFTSGFAMGWYVADYPGFSPYNDIDSDTGDGNSWEWCATNSCYTDFSGPIGSPSGGAQIFVKDMWNLNLHDERLSTPTFNAQNYDHVWLIFYHDFGLGTLSGGADAGDQADIWAGVDSTGTKVLSYNKNNESLHNGKQIFDVTSHVTGGTDARVIFIYADGDDANTIYKGWRLDDVYVLAWNDPS